MKARTVFHLWAALILTTGCTTSFNQDADSQTDAPDGEDTTDMTTDTPEDGEDVIPDTDPDIPEDVVDDEVATDCGNGTPEDGEECDDGNDTDGDGCDSDCTWTCEEASECLDDEPCNGTESCTDDHVCQDGDILEDGYVVADGDPRLICMEGVSVESTCGDGYIDTGGGEFCEPPSIDGCDDECRWGCVDDDDCLDDGDVCNGEEYCDMDAHACDRRYPAEDGTVCNESPRQICMSSNCQDSVCGDGWFDSVLEDCDDGADGDDGDGCTDWCDFSCYDSDDCDDGDVCNGNESCEVVTEGMICTSGTPAGPTTRCDDHEFCTADDFCNGGGTCVGSGDPCDDFISCTSDSCDEASGTCSSSVDSGFCVIDGSCVGIGDWNPTNQCQACRPSMDLYDWSNRTDGTDCTDNGTYCDGEESCDTGVCTSEGNPCLSSEVCYEVLESCCALDAYLDCDAGFTGIYNFDSCGNQGALEQDCYNDPPSENGLCAVSGTGVPTCECTTNWTGTRCDTCPGNWDPSADCDACIGNWDPLTDCTACLPSYYGATCDECRIYVDAGSSGGDGTSWANAIGSLQEGLDEAHIRGCEQVWVVQGTYDVGDYTGDELRLRGDVRVYGGFDGSETALSARDWRNNDTELQGTSAGMVVNCQSSFGCNGGSRLDGFIIFDGINTSYGGGLTCNGADMTLANTVMVNNEASGGGGLYAYNCDMEVINTVIRHNFGTNSGGGVFLHTSNVRFENCLIYGNEADNRGGGIYVDNNAMATLLNCTITGNSANNDMGSGSLKGGGIELWSTSSLLSAQNSIIYENLTYEGGSWIESSIDSLAGASGFQISWSDVPASDCTEYAGACGTGMVNAAPNLDSSYHPTSFSPTIDEGLDSVAPPTDLDGDGWRDTLGDGDTGTRVDMGCYDY